MARITPQGAGAMVLPSGFGAPAFTVNDVKESSTGCGCCKMRYENIAAFYPSILTVENSSQETVCCCVDLPFSRHTETFPKYKVIGVVFDEGMKACCVLPCMDCPPKICYPCCKCCAPVNHTSTFDLRAQQEEKGMFSFFDALMAGPNKNHPSFTSTEAPDKQAIRAWIFAGIVEKVNQYHCLALLRDADLVERSKPQLTL